MATIVNPRITPDVWAQAKELAQRDPPSISAEEIYAIVWAEYLYWRESKSEGVEGFAIGPISNILGAIQMGGPDLKT